MLNAQSRQSRYNLQPAYSNEQAPYQYQQIQYQVGPYGAVYPVVGAPGYPTQQQQQPQTAYPAYPSAAYPTEEGQDTDTSEEVERSTAPGLGVDSEGRFIGNTPGPYVSSQGAPFDPVHFVSPLPMQAGIDYGTLVTTALQRIRAKIVSAENDYYLATFTKYFPRFVDDFEVFIDRRSNAVHYRSASRLVKKDSGRNRKRAEKFAETLTDLISSTREELQGDTIDDDQFVRSRYGDLGRHPMGVEKLDDHYGQRAGANYQPAYSQVQQIASANRAPTDFGLPMQQQRGALYYSPASFVSAGYPAAQPVALPAQNWSFAPHWG